MKKTLFVLLASLALTACASQENIVEYETPSVERPDDGSTSGQLLEQEAPSFITE